MKIGVVTAASELPAILAEAGQLSAAFSMVRWSAERAGELIALRQEIEQQGFDRIVLWNVGEAAATIVCWTDLGTLLVAEDSQFVTGRGVRDLLHFETHKFLSFSRRSHEYLRSIGLASCHFQYAPSPADPADRVAINRRAIIPVAGEASLASVQSALEVGQRLGLEYVQLCLSSASRSYAPMLRSLCEENGAGLMAIEIRSDEDECRDGAAQGLGCCFYFALETCANAKIEALQAMARGQIVIAPDGGELADYVGHLSSGVLVDTSYACAIRRLTDDDLQRLSDGAYARARRCFQHWQQDIPRFCSVVLNDNRRWFGTDRTATFGNLIRREAHLKAKAAAGFGDA
jgi:hypothetical protein